MASTNDSPVIKQDIREIANELKDLAPKLAGKTILIAGGAGFLGRYLVLTLDYLNEHYLENPCNVIVLDNFLSGLPETVTEKEHIKLIKHDISKPIDIEGPIDYIMHAASLGSPVFYNKYRVETIDVGVIGTRNLLEMAREKNCQGFLFFSSSEVYGNPDPAFIPTKEDYNGNVACVGPRACYDEPKRLGETLSMTYADVYNLPVKIVRPFNVFGPGMRLNDGRVVPNFVVAALKGQKIPVYGNGKNTRTFCYINNAIVGFYKILLADQYDKEIFNLGSDEHEIQMGHFAELVSALVEHDDASIHTITGPNEAYHEGADPNRRCPDLTKIRTMLGYNPKVGFITGVKRFIAWAREELESQKNEKGPVAECRSCGNVSLKPVVSLGESPLANNLLNQNQLQQEDEKFPLEMVYCDKCRLCQLSYVVPPEKMFKHYLYVSSTSETFRRHFKEMADSITKEFDLGPGSLAVDIGSNDGILLQYFKENNVGIQGVEPADNLVELARKMGIDTINDFFTSSTVDDIIRVKGRADVVTANNVFAHIHDIASVTENVKTLLKDDGVFVAEVQYLLDTLRDLTFDNIYHEHLSYYSILSLQNFFKQHNMEIFDVQHVNTHGGSLRVFVQKLEGKHHVKPSVQEFVKKELDYGLDKYETYQQFAQKVYDVKKNLRAYIDKAKSENKQLVGYGAPAKATTLLNFCQITGDDVSYIVEDNPLKHDKIVPGVRIPIKGKQELDKNLPDNILIFAWNFADEIVKNNKNYQEQGATFVVPSPQLKIFN